MSKLEEIARAIYADRNGSGCKPWGNLPHSHKTPYLRDALAAVRAMREPSKQMIVAGDDEKEVCVDSYYSSGEYVTDVNSDIAARIWREMIDAILSEAKQEEG